MKRFVFISSLALGFLILCTTSLPAQLVTADFSAVDQRAKKSPQKLHDDLPALTAYLTADAKDELEKVRAIYVWITTHIAYDRKAAKQDKRINHFISDILDRKVALCYGYAQLFQKMCTLAGVTSEIVNGYAKGLSETQLPIEVPNHSWNAVRIEGSWYLLDATWGHSTLQQDDQFVQISNDDYFLIRPEQFILTHLPGNPMWQLLNDPVPAEKFMASNSAIVQHLSRADTSATLAYEDSIQQYLSLSDFQKRLYDHQQTYRSHPTSKNGEQLGHALIDYAGILSDTVEQLSQEKHKARILKLNEKVIKCCRKARQLTTFYPWQQELYLNALINQAVFRYNWQDELKMPADETNTEALAFLEEAQEILLTSKDSYFVRMAKEQCSRYIEVLKAQ